ncbi:MFS transporter [Streptomyces sp. MJP52]|uniref:MFS transporter n=1 Tax=Streptomyces chilikensis TaxID=1194079 RepID=UPI002473AA36|nr:MFS transporter [Streptomyces sp. MJP52]
MTAALYGHSFLGDCVALYPVYALLLADTGLSVGQISSLFALWSVTGVLAEVPSGAWADAHSRRAALRAGPLLTAAGFALWVWAPSYWSFAAGFALWGLGGALASGALEALVHDELARTGAVARYPAVMGRARTAETLGVVASMAAAGPLLEAGGYTLVGLVSVGACVLAAGAAHVMPEHRGPGDGPHEADGADEPDGAGASRVRPARWPAGALLLVPAVAGVWGALDEYTPLLVREAGAGDGQVSWYLLVIWAGAAAGGLLAGPAERWCGRRGLALLLVVSAASLAQGALLGAPLAVAALVGLAFAGFQLATVLADARLQRAVRGPGRATVTSVAGMGTDLAVVAAYGAYGALGASHGLTFAVLASAYAVPAAFLLLRR